MRLGWYELARHLTDWRVLAFRQNCSEVCRATHILLAAKMQGTLLSDDISFMGLFSIRIYVLKIAQQNRMDMDAKRVSSKCLGLNTALWSVSVDEFLCSLKWVKQDIVFNVFQRREFCIRPNVCCVQWRRFGSSGYAPEVFHSRIFHPCYLVPRFPLPRFQRPPSFLYVLFTRVHVQLCIVHILCMKMRYYFLLNIKHGASQFGPKYN